VQVVTAYMAEVHRLIIQTAAGRELAYFGLDLSTPPRLWSADEREAAFNPEVAMSVFDTPEVAINPINLANALRRCVADHPWIETRLRRFITGVEDEGWALRVTSKGPDGLSTDVFDHVVNAPWESRLAIDETMGLRPNRPWLHRLKYGVSFTFPAGLERPLSTTFVSGPFGEV
jgi:hypothetical protein